MKKFLGCMAIILTMVILTGCEWGNSGSGSTWSDSYSWINFAGVYRPPAGKSFLVQKPGTSTNTPSSIAQTTQSLGSGDGNQAHFEGILANKPIVVGTVVVRAGAWSMADPDGDGNIAGGEGVGVINYSSGVITVDWNLAPANGINVIVTYGYSVPGTDGNPSGPTSGSGNLEIYSLTLTQNGNVLDAIDSNGVRYHGEISNLAQGGGDRTGNTSGGVVANFTMKTDGGDQIVGVLTGNYVAPSDNDATGGDTAGGGNIKVETDTDTAPEAVTTGRLLNRQMQGTYIGADGSTGDIQGQAGGLTVTVPN